VLIGKNEIEIRQLFVEMEKHYQKARTADKPRKNKTYDSGKERNLKKVHLKIKNYKFKRVENFKYLGVILNEDNNHHVHLHERINNANITYFMLQLFSKIKTYLKN
jgi:hypothetical protein